VAAVESSTDGAELAAAVAPAVAAPTSAPTHRPSASPSHHPTAAPASAPAADTRSESGPAIGQTGDLLTRSEAFDLVKRAVESLAQGDTAARASLVRARARELLGRDSQSLSERMFIRVLKDAHDAGRIDLRRRGDDFEVARAADAEPVADQVARAERLATPTPSNVGAAAGPRVGMGPRGAGSRGRGRPGELPADLLSIGVVSSPALPPVAAPSGSATAVDAVPHAEEAEAPPAKKGRAAAGAGGRKTAAKKGASAPAAEAPPPAKTKRAAPAKKTGRPKKGAPAE
jgi:hypothetical protein